jgi:hypothetical protein
MKPPAPDVRYQAAAWAQTFREDWEECRNDPDYAAGKAWCLLAAWGDVCRLYEEPPAAIAQLPELLQRDAPALLTALRQAPEPAEWLDRARDLSSAWDGTVRTDHLRELEDIAVILFDELDRHSLAACVADGLPSDAATAEHLRTRQQQVEEAEAWFRDHVTAFLPAAKLAGAVFAACRPGLEEDEALWRTVLKHRLLEETAEELAAAPVMPRLGPHDLRAMLDKVRPPSRGAVRPAALASLDWPGWAAIAATPAPNGGTTYECLDPQQEYKALFDLAPPDQQPEVLVNFYRNGQHAGVLAGTTVRLRGVSATIDTQGRARFPRSDLEKQAGPLRLEVGEPPVVWPLLTEPHHEPRRLAGAGTGATHP